MTTLLKQLCKMHQLWSPGTRSQNFSRCRSPLHHWQLGLRIVNC